MDVCSRSCALIDIIVRSRLFSHLLEGKAQNGNAFVGNGVEHGLDDPLHKPLLLVIVDLNHLMPHSNTMVGLTLANEAGLA